MNLIQLKQYLRSRKITPLQDAAFHFQVDVETIRPLFEVWINKGKIRRRESVGGVCRGCCKCDPNAIEMYEWID